MKKNLCYLSSILLFIGTLTINAQNSNCKVLQQKINKTYKGKCRKGLANGYGTAKGRYFYQGNFKKGYPNGKGTMKYNRTDYYTGNWKKGFREGKGKLVYIVNGKENVKEGYWKKGLFIGKVKIRDYIVNWNQGVERYDFIRLNSGNGSSTNKIIIKFMQNGMNNANVSNMTITNSSGQEISNSNYYSLGYEDVTFPFKCKLSYDTPNKLKTATYRMIFNFTINKPGNWQVIVNN